MATGRRRCCAASGCSKCCWAARRRRPDVPDLEETGDAVDGRFLSVAEQLAMHRKNPACSSCHNVIDPIGLSLDAFDVTGSWRIKDRGVPVKTAGGCMTDAAQGRGRPARGAGVALGCRHHALHVDVDVVCAGAPHRCYDMPSIRRIVRDAKASNYRLSSLILGVAKAPAFRSARTD